MDVYLESGTKRVFAGALGWPGLCRSARDQNGALAALLDYGHRYGGVIREARLGPAFSAPRQLSGLSVVERLDGNATTDFGAPSIAPAVDASPVKPADLRKLQTILEACWAALDRAAATAATAATAAGAELDRGPRGGGRALDAILTHVTDAEISYAGKIAVRPPTASDPRPGASHAVLRSAVLDGVVRAATQGVPSSGPRGGAMWTPRYFVRRAAWHVLDHAWEIEDRSGVVSR